MSVSPPEESEAATGPSRSLRVLIVEDSEADAGLLVRALQRQGHGLTWRRVAGGEELKAALASETWDVVLSDYLLPGFGGLQALRIVRASGLDLPFILVSGSIGEEVAVAAMRAGAHDYLLKDRLARLGAAVARELKEAEDRRARRAAEAETRRLFEAAEQSRLALLGMVEDQQRAERALRDSEERYRTLVAHSPDGILLADLQGRFLAVNETMCRALGFSEAELLSMSLWDIVPQEQWEAHKARLARILRGENLADSFEYAVRTKADTLLSAEVRSAPYRIGGEIVGFQAIARDVTERKRSEQEQQRLHAQLTQAQKMESVGRLAGGVAHDFNNALGVILGRAEMALMGTDVGQRLRRDLEMIREAALRSADLTRQLLAFARKQTITPRLLDLNEAVAGMLSMLRRLIGEDIQLAWLPGAALGPVMMDPSQIDQVLANLLVNARDAIAGVGRVTIETHNIALDEAVRIGQTSCLAGEYVMLAVSDDGSGMGQDVLDHLFEPFFTTKAVGRGTGLGLATVYGIVQQNSGYIDVHSELGKGTTFKLYLPRAAGEMPDARAARVVQEPRGRGETILLVEDEEAMLEIGTETLADIGYSVLAARGASQALSVVESHAGEIHLLVTDVVMPEMNGRELAERVAARRPGTRCLFVSGYTADVIASRGVLDEGIRFLQKPFSRLDLARKVREALDS